LRFTSLPPGLANGTVLTVFDLGGSSVAGTLPPDYMAWQNLTVFRCVSGCALGVRARSACRGACMRTPGTMH
jgi:hypothetical protein